MIVFQAEHNILMHPFHMLGEINASPSVQKSAVHYWTFLSLFLFKRLGYDKRGFEIRLNGETPNSFVLAFTALKKKFIIEHSIVFPTMMAILLRPKGDYGSSSPQRGLRFFFAPKGTTESAGGCYAGERNTQEA